MSRSDTDPPLIETIEQITELARAFRRSRVLLTAFELDVFSAIGTGKETSEVIAERIGADHRGTDRLLNALVAIGLLVKQDHRYRNTDATNLYLVRTSPAFLSGLGHSAQLYHRWDTLTEAVKAGKTVIDRNRDSLDAKTFIEAMHRRALYSADDLIALIDLAGVHRVLDVGGGSGVFSMAFCRAKEDLTTVVLDLPRVTELTQAYVATTDFADRVSTLTGDYLEIGFGSGYDLVFFSAIIHSNSGDENRLLLRKATAALDPGGRIIIQDYVMDELRTHPPEGALFALNMLVNTRAGDTYTEGEIGGWLREAGCVDVLRLGASPTTTLLVGVTDGG